MSNEIGKTIYEQLKQLNQLAVWDWGSKEFVTTEKGLQFKTSGMVSWKGYVHIKLNEGTDLYEIDFYRIRKMEVVMDYQFKDIFAVNLVELIDNVVFNRIKKAS